MDAANREGNVIGSAGTIRDIHWSIAEWKKSNRFLTRVRVPQPGPDSYEGLVRDANEALSRYALVAEVNFNTDGRTYIRIVVQNSERLHKP